jgi:thiamine-phosphate pyrophosphorylase
VATIVNRRIDVALALAARGRADGVHLGFDAFAPRTARRLIGPSSWIGVSTHSPDELARLARAPEGAAKPAIDYAHLAPIFQPISKVASRSPLGLAGLRAASRCGVPVLAQGGLEAGNARQAIESGAAGIAVTGTLLASKDPRKAARELREALDSAR